MLELIKPKEVKLKSKDGDDFDYRIGRWVATEGIEIASGLTFGSLQEIIAKASEKDLSVILKCLKYAERIMPDGTAVRITSKDLANNHAPDWELMLTLVWEIVQYNTSFLEGGSLQKSLSQILGVLPDIATKILTQVLQQSLVKK